MTSRTSVSTQSLISIVDVSGEPPNNTCIIAGLNPVKHGPPCRNECPIMCPAATNRSLSMRNEDVDGIRWPSSPSKSSVPPGTNWGKKSSFIKMHVIYTIYIKQNQSKSKGQSQAFFCTQNNMIIYKNQSKDLIALRCLHVTSKPLHSHLHTICIIRHNVMLF